MEWILIIVVAVLLLYTIVLTFLYMTTKIKLQHQITELNQTIANITNKLYQDSGTLGRISGKIEAIDRLESGVFKTADYITQVNGKLDNIIPRVEHIYESILGKRGKTGELMLEYLLEKILLPGEYHRQFSLPDGARVDFMLTLLVEGKKKYIPIDSKFTRGKPEDVKYRIKEASKYAKYSDVGFVLMYVPSDSIYIDIVSNGDLLSFATQNDVYVVGPTALFAFVRSISLLNVAAEAKRQKEDLISSLMAMKSEIDVIITEGETVIKHNRNFTNKLQSVINRLRVLKESDRR